MPLFLSQRRPLLVEKMDREDCDLRLLENTYRQFATINLLLSQWKRIYQKELRPFMSENKTYTLLDIGFGGGDVSIKLAEWTRKDGIDLKITAIEIDKRAYDFAQRKRTSESVTFCNCSSTDLLDKKNSFDFVISNHLLHHLNAEETQKILKESRDLSKQRVIFNDIERSDLGYFLFTTFSRLLFWQSFITADGLTSIKRSYTKSELEDVAPQGWNVQRIFPFRLLLTYDKT